MNATTFRRVALTALIFGLGTSLVRADDLPADMPNMLSLGGNLHTKHTAVEVAHDTMSHSANGPLRADGHAPIGVMGDHLHKAGEWMLSYRFMAMSMSDNLNGTDNISNEQIVTTVANRFGSPTYLRVVPRDMTMKMHMAGAMYAPTDWLTLMAMGGYASKSMSHTTYQGTSGTTVLGDFDVHTSGLTDTRLSGLVRLYGGGGHKLHLNLGMSLPTGSYKESAQILAPNNTKPYLRAPYAMQLGSGTFDAMPGITYSGRADDISWGAQASAYLPLGKNDGGYSLGRSVQLTVWGAYQWQPWISTSLRLTGQAANQIDGIDSAIAVPNQTADPDNYGGDRLDLSIGVNLMGQSAGLRGHRLAAEVTVPMHQDLNGPQLSREIAFTLGYQKAF